MANDTNNIQLQLKLIFEKLKMKTFTLQQWKIKSVMIGIMFIRIIAVIFKLRSYSQKGLYDLSSWFHH
jgi:hypothetical protein